MRNAKCEFGMWPTVKLAYCTLTNSHFAFRISGGWGRIRTGCLWGFNPALFLMSFPTGSPGNSNFEFPFSWSPRRDSNSRLHPNRGCALPLELRGLFQNGGPGENRTPAPPLKRRILFQLSYRPGELRIDLDCGLRISDFGLRIEGVDLEC